MKSSLAWGISKISHTVFIWFTLQVCNWNHYHHEETRGFDGHHFVGGACELNGFSLKEAVLPECEIQFNRDKN